MSAGFEPGSTALPVVELCPTGSHLASGEQRLTRSRGKKRTKLLRRTTPVIDQLDTIGIDASFEGVLAWVGAAVAALEYAYRSGL
jgi:hypothetical protein